MELEKLRKRLSRIDNSILNQLLARQKVVTKVAQCKHKKKIPTHQPVCECEKITGLVKSAVKKGLEDTDLVINIFRLIFISSRAQQEKCRKGMRRNLKRTPPH